MRAGLCLWAFCGLVGLIGCQSSSSSAINASDDAAIADALPKDIHVIGTVSSIDAGGEVIAIHFVGTDKNNFYAVVLGRGRDAMEKAFGSGVGSLKDKTIEVTGKITLYRGKPEIVLNGPDQVVVLQ